MLAGVPVAGAWAQSAKPYVDVTFLIETSKAMMVAATVSGINSLQPLTAGSSCFQVQGYKGGMRSGLPVPPYGTATSSCAGIPFTCTQGSTVVSSMTDQKYGIWGLQGCQCAYACHWTTTGNDYLTVARQSSILLRFDAVQSAVETAIQWLPDQETVPDQFGVSIFTFATGVTRLWPPPGDPDVRAIKDMACLVATDGRCSGNALAAAQAITPQLIDDSSGSNFPAAMTGVVAAATPSRQGGSPVQARKALIIITDGIQDWGNRTFVPDYSLSPSAGTSGGAEGPISQLDCDAIKALGYTVYVLYTTYDTTPASMMIYNEALVPYINGTTGTASDLPPNLEGCASSPAHYAQASDPTSIQTVLSAMVKAAITPPAEE